MIMLTINNKTIISKPGKTLLEIANNNGIKILTICHLPKLKSRSVCRMCVVQIESISGLLPACSTIAEAGMVVTTDSDLIKRTQKTLMNFLLAEQGADFELLKPDIKAIAKTLGIHKQTFSVSSLSDAQSKTFNAKYGSEYILLDPNKCIHCDRCINACMPGIIKRAKRGAQTIYTFGENNNRLHDSRCTNCSDCINVCPSGAIREA